MDADRTPDPLKQLADDELLARLPAAAALPDAPAAWVQRAIEAWQPSLSVRLAEAAQGLREQVQAWLRFDSWTAAPLATGLRSTGTSATRQLIFSAEGRDVDLRIVPAEGSHFSVSGQVLGPDERGTITLAREDGTAAREAPLDDFGEFHLPAVEPGRYRLRLVLPTQEVQLPAFDVGGPIRFVGKDGDPA
ncbi:carboxypeptidase-like regulatory domain-containing protein [Ideonella sp. YS5]|uniref:carboxypeptidase-like regulatory domain-containing protein n=1 Tax=Ideonella sp. YS5 TaxID=3453714 RepID=UPI003EEA5820